MKTRDQLILETIIHNAQILVKLRDTEAEDRRYWDAKLNENNWTNEGHPNRTHLEYSNRINAIQDRLEEMWPAFGIDQAHYYI